MKINPSNLLDIHAKIQKGTYFSGIESLKCKDLKFAYSEKIKDIYWNYAYNINCTSKELGIIISQINSFADSIDRDCTLYITPDTNPANIIELLNPKEIEEEVWMTINKSDFEIEAKLEIEIIQDEKPSEDFIYVFDNAYGNGEINAPGYTNLPLVYIDSIKNSSPDKDVSIVHFIGRVDNKAVAVSSIYLFGKYAGLYNVGTLHSARRNNYGSEISKVAVQFALNQDCEIIFLQTKADSEVEILYKKIGFERAFIGTFIKL